MVRMPAICTHRPVLNGTPWHAALNAAARHNGGTPTFSGIVAKNRCDMDANPLLILRSTDRHRAVNLHRRLEAEGARATLATGILVVGAALCVAWVMASAVGLVDSPFAEARP